MYELVQTAKQQRQFATTWEYFCDEFGWVNDPYSEDGFRYNLLLDKKEFLRRKKVIGTIELTPYNPTNPNSTVEGRFAFSNFPEINRYQDRTWEIDKLCIHQDYQRQGYFTIFSHILYNHAMNHNPKYYLALIEKKFFRMLRFSFGSCFEQKGDALIGPGTSLIPTCADVEALVKYYNTKMGIS